MLTKAQVMARLREHYPILVARYGVKRVGVFGSFAKGTPTESSDIDLLIEFERPLGLQFVDLGVFGAHIGAARGRVDAGRCARYSGSAGRP